MSLSTLKPSDFVDMGEYQTRFPIVVDIAYARGDNFLFAERIYRPDAKLWLYKDLADVVLNAAEQLYQEHRLRLKLFDGLRTTTAQAKMLETQIVKDNPQWLEEPRLLSPPGQGGHPRGMAIDLTLCDEHGNELDMGTPFDDLTALAHRESHDISDEAKSNRAILERMMLSAADDVGVEILALPQEWWDFRLPAAVYERCKPLADEDLPHEMRMCG